MSSFGPPAQRRYDRAFTYAAFALLFAFLFTMFIA